MFISKSHFTHPNPVTKNFDQTIYNHAKRFYEHFNNLNLWYISRENNAHVIYHDNVRYKINPYGVDYSPLEKPIKYTVVNIDGDLVVKVGRVCKPIIYYPNLLIDGQLAQGIEVTSDAECYPTPLWLKDYCFTKNRSQRKVMLTKHTYPVPVSISASGNEIKLIKHFKQVHGVDVKVVGRNAHIMAALTFHYIRYTFD